MSNRRRTVSEKTLEVNVLAELLFRIRRMPGCRRAFWIGMKQDQEARNGIDDLITNVPRGRHLALQFKAPAPKPADRRPMRFTINDRQNQNLVRLAMGRPKSAYYVLPHINSMNALRKAASSLLPSTYLLPVSALRGLPPATNKRGTHAVISNPPRVDVFSDPMQLELLSVDQMVGETLLSDSKTEELLDHRSLQQWLDALLEEARGNSRILGQRLRGFSTIFVPN